jgi:methylase of polypeptide subunit release factors
MKTMALETSIQCHKDACRKSLSKYTTRAFQAIPRIEAPTILDIGCGSGVPTLELSRRCDGEVIGLDIDRSLLDLLEEKIRRAGLSDRVRAVEGSMF